MYRSFALLARLRLQGSLRKVKRALFSIKGGILLGAGLGFFALVFGPALLFRPIHRPGDVPPPAASILQPAMLFMLWLATTVGGRLKSPLAFSLAEVDLLFPAPFSRRQLLICKLTESALGVLGFAVLVPVFAAQVMPWWASALLGSWLTINFMQMSTVFLALVFDWFGERFRPWRWPAAVLLAVAVTWLVWQAGVFDADQTFPERMRALEADEVVRGVLAPFVVFSRLLLAETGRELLIWGAGALVLNVLVLLAILRMDANFLEASLLASQRRYEWIERAKRGGGLPSWTSGGRPRFSLPSVPRLGGAGTIAWRQFVQLFRGSNRLLFILPVIVGPFVGIFASGRASRGIPPEMIVGTTMFLSFFITTIIPLGMRNDLQHVELLKTLPVSARAIAAGSIGAALGYTTAIQVLITLAEAVVGGVWAWQIGAAVAFAGPINLLLIVFDSLQVLLFPGSARLEPGDVLAGARLLLGSLAKMLFVVLTLGIAALAVSPIYIFWRDARLAMAVVGWLTLTAEGLVAAWITGVLFARFDPSLEGAGEK